jgi:phage shock protein A
MSGVLQSAEVVVINRVSEMVEGLRKRLAEVEKKLEETKDAMENYIKRRMVVVVEEMVKKMEIKLLFLFL